jgi:hypothetical protein
LARYNIEVRTESHVADTTTLELEDLTKLRLEVARFVGELLRDHASQIWLDQDWRVDVTDGSGLILFIMNVSAQDVPAAA